jgi:hypothetical protein
MKTKSYQQLLVLKDVMEEEVKAIEEKYQPVIQRYLDLKGELTRITPLLNKAILKPDHLRR